MPIVTKPERVTLSGEDARAAIVDGVQRKLAKRIDEKTIVVVGDAESADMGRLTVTVDVVGHLKGPKAGTKRKPSAKKPPGSPAA